MNNQILLNVLHVLMVGFWILVARLAKKCRVIVHAVKTVETAWFHLVIAQHVHSAFQVMFLLMVIVFSVPVVVVFVLYSQPQVKLLLVAHAFLVTISLMKDFPVNFVLLNVLLVWMDPFVKLVLKVMCLVLPLHVKLNVHTLVLHVNLIIQTTVFLV